MECLNVAGDVVPDRECEGVKPETEESCDMGVCAKGWYHTAWSEEVVSHRYLSQCMRFPTMWYFDKCRFRRACVNSF